MKLKIGDYVQIIGSPADGAFYTTHGLNEVGKIVQYSKNVNNKMRYWIKLPERNLAAPYYGENLRKLSKAEFKVMKVLSE